MVLPCVEFKFKLLLCNSESLSQGYLSSQLSNKLDTIPASAAPSLIRLYISSLITTRSRACQARNLMNWYPGVTTALQVGYENNRPIFPLSSGWSSFPPHITTTQLLLYSTWFNSNRSDSDTSESKNSSKFTPCRLLLPELGWPDHFDGYFVLRVSLINIFSFDERPTYLPYTLQSYLGSLDNGLC